MKPQREAEELANLPPEQQRFIAEAKAFIAFTTAKMSDGMTAAGVIEPEKRAANVIQNAMRTMLEVSLNSVPYHTVDLPIGMAFRLASYALSALPDDEQESAVLFFLENFAETHGQRLAAGIRLDATWAFSPPSSETAQ